MNHTFSLTTKSVEETENLGQRLSQLLQPGDVICLFGDLGSGKTALARGFCSGLGCNDDVTSPTFTIINEYAGKFPVYHFDLYRLESEEEIFDLGYEEYFFGEGVCLIEWAERALSLYPKERIEIYLEPIFEKGKESWRIIRFNLLLPAERISDWKNMIKEDKIAAAKEPA